jgi:hypothetical protein
MESIYALRPINGTASRVVSQSGCGDGQLTPEQERSVLIERKLYLDDTVRGLSKNNPRRKEIVKEIMEILARLTELREIVKRANRMPSLSEDVMYILKQELTAMQYTKLIDRAKKRHDLRMEEFNKNQ